MTAVRSAWMVAGGLAAAGLLWVGCGDTKPTKSTSYNLPASVKSLDIKGEVGRVKVTAEKGASGIKVVEKRTDNAKPSHPVAGSTGTLKYSCPGGFNIDTCRVDYDITVPETVAIKVDNSGGEITLDGALSDVDANADAGKIGATGLGGGTVTASTQAGEIDLAFASPPRQVTTTADTGATTITVPGSASYQVKADASIGDTNVDVPNDPSAQNRIEAKADVGEISIKKS